MGSGRCVWDDLKDFPWKSYEIMTVNDMVMHFPWTVSHAYSNDWEMLPKWVAARRPRYRLEYDVGIQLHSCHPCPGASLWDIPGNGTSSLGAVLVGQKLGYQKIVLAGVPLDGSGHYFDPPDGFDGSRKWSNFDREVSTRENGQIRFWSGIVHDLSNVRSLSGRTRELLGPP